MMSEPDPRAPACRRFVDPAYRPLCGTLAEVRAGIDALDDQLIELLARRADLVMDATRFKRDAGEAAAPARQAQVYARARALAQRRRCAFPGLDDVAEATWRAMVAAFVAREQALLAATEPIGGADAIARSRPDPTTPGGVGAAPAGGAAPIDPIDPIDDRGPSR
jgi:isochorismate pyruvate lyase